MAVVYPTVENILRLKVSPTPGEMHLVTFLQDNLDDSYEIFFNPYLDGDRPDIIILKEHHAAFVIEVKDWNLDNYRVSENNKWTVHDGVRSSPIGSPQSQAFRYKKNLYDLHLPVIGIAHLGNRTFYNLVHCFVYLHESDKDAINSFYLEAERKQKSARSELNERYRAARITFDAYETKSERISRQERNLRRDKTISFGTDQLSLLARKIKEKSSNPLFSDEVYRDFKRRLSPPEHTLNQGIPLSFDRSQYPLTLSAPEMAKVKGVAGSGKTSVLAQRAVNADLRHASNTLILSFNITLKNYIRDKLSDIQGYRNNIRIEVSNYHQFFNSQLNNLGLNIAELINSFGLEKMYSVDHFENEDVIKFQTILIDEIQDYEPEWVKIIRDNFLEDDGEMILFGDLSQNIYGRESDRSPVIAQGFGAWKELKRSYRTKHNSPLSQLFKNFQLKFLLEGNQEENAAVDTAPLEQLALDLLRYEKLDTQNWLSQLLDSVRDYIRIYDLHPNDVVILSSNVSRVRQLNELWLQTEKTLCMFETLEELSQVTYVPVSELSDQPESAIIKLVKENIDAVERIRRTKKNHFYSNSGLVKLSTTHSFKGLESKSVFYVMADDDSPEIIYTSITRAARNLILFDLGGGNTCSSFLSAAMK